MSRGAPQRQEIIKQTIVVRDGALTVDGATGVGFGALVIGDLPEGNILLLGAVGYFTFAGPTSADLADDWEGDYGVGTTPADDATITAADIDVIGSTAIVAATAEASPRTRGVGVTATNAAILDNTDGSLELNLSLLIDDADIGADDIIMTVNGELFLAYIVLGDD
jgi:hypothetical protein